MSRPRTSPLPQRHGLDAVRCVVPPSTPPRTAEAHLLERYPALASPGATSLLARFAAGEVVRSDGTPWQAEDLVHPHDVLWFHRELAPEQVDPVELPVLLHDEHLLVIDKPHGIATMPRGRFVRSSALVRLRCATGITTLTPLHRLDRLTAGVLAFGIRPQERSAYQQMFARGEVRKEYRAWVQAGEDARIPREPGAQMLLEDHLLKPRGSLQVQVGDGPVNARTHLEVLQVDTQTESGRLLLRLQPETGRTHQLRVQLASRGAPILGDDLYPQLRGAQGEDATAASVPLQLLASRVEFTDPVTGQRRCLRSARRLVP